MQITQGNHMLAITGAKADAKIGANAGANTGESSFSAALLSVSGESAPEELGDTPQPDGNLPAPNLMPGKPETGKTGKVLPDIVPELPVAGTGEHQVAGLLSETPPSEAQLSGESTSETIELLTITVGPADPVTTTAPLAVLLPAQETLPGEVEPDAEDGTHLKRAAGTGVPAAAVKHETADEAVQSGKHSDGSRPQPRATAIRVLQEVALRHQEAAGATSADRPGIEIALRPDASAADQQHGRQNAASRLMQAAMRNNAQTAAPGANMLADPASPIVGTDGLIVPVRGETPAPAMQSANRQLFEIEAAVERMIETRMMGRATRSAINVPHPDFGRVTLAFSVEGDRGLTVDMPGAPSELRNAVGQALAQQNSGDAASTRSDRGNGAGSALSTDTGEGQTDTSADRSGEADAQPNDQNSARTQGNSAEHSAAGSRSADTRSGIFA